MRNRLELSKKWFVSEGTRLPWWLGVAYWEWERPVAACYPIPFNLVVRWARNTYFWVKATHRPDWSFLKFGGGNKWDSQ